MLVIVRPLNQRMNRQYLGRLHDTKRGCGQSAFFYSSLVYPNTIGKNVKSPVVNKQQRMDTNDGM